MKSRKARSCRGKGDAERAGSIRLRYRGRGEFLPLERRGGKGFIFGRGEQENCEAIELEFGDVGDRAGVEDLTESRVDWVKSFVGEEADDLAEMIFCLGVGVGFFGCEWAR